MEGKCTKTKTKSRKKNVLPQKGVAQHTTTRNTLQGLYFAFDVFSAVKNQNPC